MIVRGKEVDRNAAGVAPDAIGRAGHSKIGLAEDEMESTVESGIANGLQFE